MKLLPKCMMTLTLMTFVLCDLSFAFKLLRGNRSNSEDTALKAPKWLPHLDEQKFDLKSMRTGSDSHPNKKRHLGLHRNSFFETVAKKLDQLERTTEEEINRMIEESLVKYSFRCLLHDSRACLKADWLRAQQNRDDWLKPDIEIATDNYDVKSEINNMFQKYQKGPSKRGPMISVDQSLHAIDKGEQRSSVGDRRESSMSRLDMIGR